MDYISQLKEMNVKFIAIDEKEASEIMATRYPYYKLIEFSGVFEKYRSLPQEGKFVNLEFAQMYFLALIDSKLSQIMMNVCLQIEQFLKTTFIYDVHNFGDTQKLLNEYYKSDEAYLSGQYISENYEILNLKYKTKNLSQLDFCKVIDVIQFGTLERMMHFFYKEFAPDIYHSRFAPFEKLLPSMRRIRNTVAHNNAILSQLTVKGENKALEVSAFLGRKGVKSRMLKTNLSKQIISDLCNVLFLYYKYVPGVKTEVTELFQRLDIEYCKKYGDFFKTNDMLKSCYDFLKLAIEIFVDSFEKVLDK